MADTIITNTPDRGDSSASAAGWVVALIVLAVVVIGGIYFYRHGAAGSAGGTNINVTVPGVGGGATGGSTGQ